MELIYSGFEQHFMQDGHPFFAHIYSGKGALPNGFNVGTICLDASEHASLKWEIDTDYSQVLWELDFALDEAVLNDELRYLALELAVDHFTKSIWPQVEEKTFGVSLYRGPFMESLLDPLKSLASHLPESVRPFIFLDTDSIPDPRTYFRSINQAELGYLTPVLKGKWPERYPYAFPALAWNHPNSLLGIFSDTLYPPLPERRLSVGVLVPESGDFPVLEGATRMIPEQILTHEWEGVDQLIVVSSSVNERTQRKLRGFEAAGGEVIFTDCLNDGAMPLLRETSQLSCPAASH